MAKKKRTPLVSQYMEQISSEVFDDYQQLLREYVRNRHGVYALYRREKLYYVGLAKDLRGRLKTHLKDRHAQKWDRFSVYLTITDSHVKELESLLLRIVQPKGNRIGGGFARAQNLKKELRTRIRSEQKMRMEALLGRTGPRRKQSVRVAKLESENGPVLARYAKRPRVLRANYKGKRYAARVLRDGRISYGGVKYNSPSMAGVAVIKRPCNGWDFWTYERAPGEWVRLKQLRS
jgi:hypothetical protein